MRDVGPTDREASVPPPNGDHRHFTSVSNIFSRLFHLVLFSVCWESEEVQAVWTRREVLVREVCKYGNYSSPRSPLGPP